jgi:putative oxidoreductase
MASRKFNRANCMKLLVKLTSSQAPNAVLLVRVMVGAVFLSEGIQKFLFPADVGAGRFAKIGLPSPEFLGPFVGSFEIACGTLVLLGLLTRLAVIPLLTIMAVALYSTKLPILLQAGFWKMAHEARADFSMVMGSLLLLIVGAGAWSWDAWLKLRLASKELSGAEK